MKRPATVFRRKTSTVTFSQKTRRMRVSRKKKTEKTSKKPLAPKKISAEELAAHFKLSLNHMEQILKYFEAPFQLEQTRIKLGYEKRDFDELIKLIQTSIQLRKKGKI